MPVLSVVSMLNRNTAELLYRMKKLMKKKIGPLCEILSAVM
jgi:hypothetical protein